MQKLTSFGYIWQIRVLGIRQNENPKKVVSLKFEKSKTWTKDFVDLFSIKKLYDTFCV